MVAQHYSQLSKPLGTFDDFYCRFKELDKRGKNQKLETFASLINQWQLPTSPEEMWSAYKNEVASCCALYPDVLPALRALRAKELELGIVTNGTVECQENKIKQLELDNEVGLVLISEREGVRKPHKEIFLKASYYWNLLPEEICVVGDDWQADVEGALGAEMQAVWLSRNREAAVEPYVLTVKSLSQLTDLKLLF